MLVPKQDFVFLCGLAGSTLCVLCAWLIGDKDAFGFPESAMSGVLIVLLSPLLTAAGAYKKIVGRFDPPASVACRTYAIVAGILFGVFATAFLVKLRWAIDFL